MEPEQKRSGTCGACETIRVAKLARAKVVGGEAGEEVGKVEVGMSLPLRGKGRGPVRQSARLRDRGIEEPMKLTRR